MTPLVELYGLRACPLGCAGRCVKATESHGTVKPSADCQLMRGPPPAPGQMPALVHHTVEQLQAMTGRGGDRDVAQAAAAELARRY